MLFFFPGAHFRAGARFEGPETIARQIRVVFDEILDFSVILAKMCRNTLFFKKSDFSKRFVPVKSKFCWAGIP